MFSDKEIFDNLLQFNSYKYNLLISQTSNISIKQISHQNAPLVDDGRLDEISEKDQNVLSYNSTQPSKSSKFEINQNLENNQQNINNIPLTYIENIPSLTNSPTQIYIDNQSYFSQPLKKRRIEIQHVNKQYAEVDSNIIPLTNKEHLALQAEQMRYTEDVHKVYNFSNVPPAKSLHIKNGKRNLDIKQKSNLSKQFTLTPPTNKITSPFPQLATSSQKPYTTIIPISLFKNIKVKRVLIILNSNLIKEYEEYKIIKIEEKKITQKITDAHEKKYEIPNLQIDTCYLQSELNILKNYKYDYIISLNSSLSNILSCDKMKYKVTESYRQVKVGRVLKIYVSNLYKSNYTKNEQIYNSLDFKCVTGQNLCESNLNNKNDKNISDVKNSTLLSIFCGINFSENNILINERIEKYFSSLEKDKHIEDVLNNLDPSDDYNDLGELQNKYFQ